MSDFLGIKKKHRDFKSGMKKLSSVKKGLKYGQGILLSFDEVIYTNTNVLWPYSVVFFKFINTKEVFAFQSFNAISLYPLFSSTLFKSFKKP